MSHEIKFLLYLKAKLRKPSLREFHSSGRDTLGTLEASLHLGLAKGTVSCPLSELSISTDMVFSYKGAERAMQHLDICGF